MSPRCLTITSFYASFPAGLFAWQARLCACCGSSEVALCVYARAGLSYSRWAVELGTLVQYAGLDADWQHLALFKLAQMVRPHTLDTALRPACIRRSLMRWKRRPLK